MSIVLVRYCRYTTERVGREVLVLRDGRDALAPYVWHVVERSKLDVSLWCTHRMLLWCPVCTGKSVYYYRSARKEHAASFILQFHRDECVLLTTYIMAAQRVKSYNQEIASGPISTLTAQSKSIQWVKRKEHAESVRRSLKHNRERVQRVETIRLQITTGTYSINTQAIAQKILALPITTNILDVGDSGTFTFKNKE